MSQQMLNSDTFFDSDDLMNWLLLNPEIADFDSNQMPLFPLDSFTFSPDAKLEDVSETSPTTTNNHNSTDNTANIGMKRERNDSGDESTRKGSAQKGSGKKRTKGEAEKDIETRVNELRAENADLQAHLMNVTQRTTEVQKQRTAMEKLMHAKLAEMGDKEGADQSELAQTVKQYTDIYADYGKCRQREVAFHVDQLEKLILPTMTTKMCLWALQQDKSFYQRSKSPMFELLSKELEITPEQTERIQERRDKIVKLLRQLNEGLDLLKAFKAAIEKKHTSYDNICGKVQHASSPKQTVQFLLWITKNAEQLARHIPNFSRNMHHTPNIEFIDPNVGSSKGCSISNSNSSSSSSSSSNGSNSSNGNGKSSQKNITQQGYYTGEGQYKHST